MMHGHESNHLEPVLVKRIAGDLNSYAHINFLGSSLRSESSNFRPDSDFAEDHGLADA